ncbi:MAG: KTSC domain-containing protein [Pedobacter sp.]|nr:MAG: KTSC domain-containing protein [Pedobacter sp.]
MPSSVIAKIKYSVETQELIIVFLSGDAYLYPNVPEKVYKEFKASISKGTYLNRKFKKLFTGTKIND